MLTTETVVVGNAVHSGRYTLIHSRTGYSVHSPDSHGYRNRLALAHTRIQTRIGTRRQFQSSLCSPRYHPTPNCCSYKNKKKFWPGSANTFIKKFDYSAVRILRAGRKLSWGWVFFEQKGVFHCGGGGGFKISKLSSGRGVPQLWINSDKNQPKIFLNKKIGTTYKLY